MRNASSFFFPGGDRTTFWNTTSLDVPVVEEEEEVEDARGMDLFHGFDGPMEGRKLSVKPTTSSATKSRIRIMILKGRRAQKRTPIRDSGSMVMALGDNSASDHRSVQPPIRRHSRRQRSTKTLCTYHTYIHSSCSKDCDNN